MHILNEYISDYSLCRMTLRASGLQGLLTMHHGGQCLPCGLGAVRI